MKIRLNKVQKELNLGLSTIVEFLQKKGIEIKEDPNAVVPEEGYQMLIEEFSADKKARMQSDSFTQERKNKEKPKAAPVVEEKPVVNNNWNNYYPVTKPEQPKEEKETSQEKKKVVVRRKPVVVAKTNDATLVLTHPTFEQEQFVLSEIIEENDTVSIFNFSSRKFSSVR